MQPVVITKEKAEKIIRVIEQMLHRRTGKNIKITSYRIVDHDAKKKSQNAI